MSPIRKEIPRRPDIYGGLHLKSGGDPKDAKELYKSAFTPVFQNNSNSAKFGTLSQDPTLEGEQEFEESITNEEIVNIKQGTAMIRAYAAS